MVTEYSLVTAQLNPLMSLCKLGETLSLGATVRAIPIAPVAAT